MAVRAATGAGGAGNSPRRSRDRAYSGHHARKLRRLLPPLDDRYSARRGTYRVIYRVDDHARIVTVVDIGHRRDIYRT